ncbi:hypothetical protein [Hymenobacter chitinivorans]|uniref:TonB-dependent receptor-like protein n=1 Tax=Hymenobacter chitinivorans DSM 11115 TaxID=1121954 RepID=A0A2M9BT24_9BACT|nr:hypothetical protein [Hymenobacter chitinivorans]PJJ61110.1 hypothetical protein CLV45_2548 [Hymenobacter chitinivorans DSM 11115]
MQTYFLRLLFLTTLSLCSATAYGQETATSKALKQIPEPLFIINSTIIANGRITTIDPKDYKDIMVYRNPTAPEILKNVTSGGIIAITYEGPIESKSFAQVARQHGVRGPVSIVLNGHKLSAEQAATLRIAPEAIDQVQVTRATADSAETTLAIQLTVLKSDSTKYPPGTIMIR